MNEYLCIGMQVGDNLCNDNYVYASMHACIKSVDHV